MKSKKMLVLLIGVMALLVSLSVSVFAVDIDYDDIGDDDYGFTVYDNAKYLAQGDNPYYLLAEVVSTDITTCAIHPDTKAIEKYAFSNCGDLTEIAIPSGVTAIEDGVFYGCDSLNTITIPISVTTIGEDAFFGCVTLLRVYYNGLETQWQKITIKQNNGALSTADLYYAEVCPHVYDNDCDTTCNACDETRTIEHDYAAATCRKPKTCKNCGATSGSKLGHSYKSFTATKATLTKGGLTKYECTRCGYVASTTKYIYNPATFKLSATSYTYARKVQTPTVTVEDSAGNTISPSYYTVTYASGRKDVGTYKVTVKMQGKYSGTKELSFKITPIKSTTCTFKLSTSSYTYDRKERTPSVTVKNAKGTTLTKGTHYTVTYASGRKNVGTYKVTIKMKGNYSGTKELSFKITPIKSTTCTFKLSTSSYTYNGKERTPSVTVKNAKGTTLTKGTHYTVTYASGRKNVGTYKVTVKMKGNYSGTKELTFKIIPKAASVNTLTAKTKALTVKVNRQMIQATGYQIQYSTTQSFKSYNTATITSYKTSTKTLSNLKAKTNYYVRVRTYKTVNGTKYYSGWSAIKYMKTK